MSWSVRDIILIDGTYQRGSELFPAAVSVHGYTDGSYTPLVFILLKDKNKHIYLIF